MSKTNDANNNPGCLAGLMGLFKGKPRIEESDSEKPNVFPYRVRDDFLSPAEQSFYQVIKGMMGEHFTICPKVGLADLFFVIRPNENKSAYNHINRKHVDFLICAAKTMKPVFAIELDDSTHSQEKRIARDEFVDQVFAAARLPIVHIPAQMSYSTAELGGLFRNAVQASNAAAPEPVQPAAPAIPAEPVQQPPTCPKCGVSMVLRTAQKGDQPGKKFYGCPNYPRCRVVLPFEK